MVKSLKSSHLLLQLFDKLCMEKCKKTYILILFTKARWGTVYYAAQRASLVKTACASFLILFTKARWGTVYYAAQRASFQDCMCIFAWRNNEF